MNPVWLKYARVLDLKERLVQKLRPDRLRVIPYSWPLAADVCPCDVDFCDYLAARAVHGSSIFHFGTGGHHLVGLRNHRDHLHNDILAITASPAEHARYVRLLKRDAALGAHYKVLFGDIYDLKPALPVFDYVSLFHLCEFSPRPAQQRRLDDRGLLALMAARLGPRGRLLFYSGSDGRRATAALLAEAVASGQLQHEEDFRSLKIYAAAADGT